MSQPPILKTVEAGSSYNPEASNSRSLFIDQYPEAVEELFGILGMAESWTPDISALVNATQPWVKGDHFQPLHRTVLLGAAAARAHNLYEAMGLVHAEQLPGGTYDQLMVLGGTQRANNLRLKFLNGILARSDVEIGESGLVLWSGQRPMIHDLEVEHVRANLQELEQNYHPAHHNPWLVALQNKGSMPASETELLRLSALSAIGEATLKKAHIRLGVEKAHVNIGAGEPLISHYELQGEEHKMTLLNTLAVSRPQGEPRHTTEACAEHWIEVAPPHRNSTVAFVTANPYILRTTRVVQSILTTHKRNDIKLVACGPAAYQGAKDYLFLGEIARNIYEDYKVIASSS